MRRAVAVAAVAAVAVTGCTSLAAPPDRRATLERIIASSVQLRGELEGNGRRSGSGVVIASEASPARCWILTTKHLLQPNRPRRILAIVPGHREPLAVEIVAVSDDLDLAIVTVQGIAPPAVTLKDTTRLGEDVWVVGFPWGRRLTVASGVVSQVGGADDTHLEGPARMVDASVSYGASGGGVFEAATGALVAIVEGYRTARVTLPHAPESVLHIPVPGETTVVSAAGIRKFLATAGLDRPRR
jgi:S1-C subfamily serine protease